MAISNWTAEQRQRVEEIVLSQKFTRYIDIANELGLQSNDVRNYIKNRPNLLKAFKPNDYEQERARIAKTWDLEEGL